VPQAGEGGVLIKAEWVGVNYIDTYFRAGVYPTPFPFTLGQEVSGTIVSLPSDAASLSQDQDFQARNLAVGDKVVALASKSFAEYVVAPWKHVIKLPAGVDTRTAVAVNLQGLTALTALREAYEVKKGDWVLVHAAAGGLGLHLTQIASRIGAHVIGTTSTPEKAAIAKENGAEHVILYTKESVVDRVNELTGGQGVHGIIDGVGKDTWEDNLLVARRKGTIVSLGNASGVVPPFAPLKLTPKNLKLVRPTVSNYVFTPAEALHYWTELFEFVAQPGYKVNIHKEYEFTAEGIQQTHKDITGRGTVGKLLVKVA